MVAMWEQIISLITSVVVSEEVMAIKFDFTAFQFFLIMSETHF